MCVSGSSAWNSSDLRFRWFVSFRRSITIIPVSLWSFRRSGKISAVSSFWVYTIAENLEEFSLYLQELFTRYERTVGWVWRNWITNDVVPNNCGKSTSHQEFGKVLVGVGRVWTTVLGCDVPPETAPYGWVVDWFDRPVHWTRRVDVGLPVGHSPHIHLKLYNKFITTMRLCTHSNFVTIFFGR